jgi:hypothetical protein
LEAHDPRSVVEAYRESFDRKDASACAAFYADDAVLKFLFGTFQGRKNIEDWHRDRFAAEVQILRVDDLAVSGSQVQLNAVVTSRKLKRFRMDEVKGTAVFVVRDGRFQEATFGARRGVASHLDWHFR